MTFASASAVFNDTVGCVTLQCLDGYSLTFGAPPEVEHFVLGRPARPQQL